MNVRILFVCGLAALTAANTPVRAEDSAVATTSAEQQPAARAGVRVLMNPATGTVRDPAPEEAAPARAKSSFDVPRADYSRMTQHMKADGSVQLDTNGQIRAYATVRVDADGTIRPQCVGGGDDHDHAAHDGEGPR